MNLCWVVIPSFPTKHPSASPPPKRKPLLFGALHHPGGRATHTQKGAARFRAQAIVVQREARHLVDRGSKRRPLVVTAWREKTGVKTGAVGMVGMACWCGAG